MRLPNRCTSGKDQMEMPALMTHTPFSSWCTVAFALAVASVLAAQSTTPAAPDQAALETMTARFAPTEITADVSGLPAGERQALGKLVQASRIIDALFLRQVWAGNEALLMRLLTDDTPLGRARLHAFLVNKGPWSRLDHDAPFIPGVPAEARRRRTSIPPARRRRRWRRGLQGCLPTSAGGPPASSPPSAARRRTPQPFVAVPYSLEYQGELARAAELLREAAAPDRAADAEALPRDARRRVPLQRLLRERRRLDGARRVDRAHHRSLRGLRGRVVQLQGGVRGLHHGARRRRERQAGAILRRAAGDREPPADRPGAAQPEARRARAHPRGERGLRRGRRQPRRADRRLQPAERRAGRAARRAPSA